jgi:polyisoprenoid-binding protein YceI
MKTIISIFIFLGLLNANYKTFGQTKLESQITFKIKNMGVSVKGKFTDVFIEKSFNKDDLNNSYINATIKVNSLDTGNKNRDEHLMKSDFFDIDTFPIITFSSININRIQGNNYNLKGNLTIKNITKVITIPLLIEDATLSSRLDLNRIDYRVGRKSWILSRKVKIEVELVLNED